MKPEQVAARLGAAARGTWRQRLRATAIHFSLSLVVFAAAVVLIVAHWYPGFHFTVDGGWQGLRIMAAVDLVLGPLLTLIIFNPLKSRGAIVFDLTCIGLAQAAALAWGFYAVHSQHPVAVSYYEGSFNPVTVEPLRTEQYPVSRLAELSDRRPALVYSAPPANDDERGRAAMQSMLGVVAEWEDPFFFRAFAPHWAEVERKALRADARAAADPAFARDLPGFLAEHGGRAEDYRFYPYAGRYGACTLALTAGGQVIGALGCAPH